MVLKFYCNTKQRCVGFNFSYEYFLIVSYSIFFGLKAQFISAQGNALGIRFEIIPKRTESAT